MVDWWAVGIIAYELFFGKTPFYDRNRHKILSNIGSKKVYFPSQATHGYSNEFKDLIQRLLTKDPTKRLGLQDDHLDVLLHPFFNIDFIDAIDRKAFKP